MKRLLLSLLLLSSTLFAAAQIKLTVDYATFNTTSEDSYIEIYLSVNGRSLTYELDSNKTLEAKVEMTYLIEKDNKVVAFKKFQLNSPKYKNTGELMDMLDLKRIPIKNGIYSLTIIAKDLKNDAVTEDTIQLKTIEYDAKKMQFSEIQLANSIQKADGEGTFVKNGLSISPNLSHYYRTTDSTLYFYAELYNSQKAIKVGNDFLMEYSIVEKGGNQIAGDFRGIKREKRAAVIPMSYSFDLKDLPSGKYDLLLQAKNKENEVMAKQRISFERNNRSLLDYSTLNLENTFVDTLSDAYLLSNYIRSLQPISTPDEIQYAYNIIANGDIDFMKRYFLNFWQTRNATDPADEWLKYKKKVIKVNELFGYGNIQGYTTERGRVYLQYGRPDVMRNVTYEYNTYPYSVWQYRQLNGKTNRKFIFYSPSMEMLGYKVLHSNVNGEVNNPNWEIDLESKTNAGSMMGKEVQDGTTINRNARDLWENPR